jgi:hypothetical protein
MKEFFLLDELFTPYYEPFIAQIPEIESRKIREEYREKIDKFILKECRAINKISGSQDIEMRL